MPTRKQTRAMEKVKFQTNYLEQEKGFFKFGNRLDQFNLTAYEIVKETRYDQMIRLQSQNDKNTRGLITEKEQELNNDLMSIKFKIDEINNRIENSKSVILR